VARDLGVDSSVHHAARLHTPHASITSSTTSTGYSPTQPRASISHELQPHHARWVAEVSPTLVSAGTTPIAQSAIPVPIPVPTSMAASRITASPRQPPEKATSDRFEIFVRQQPAAARACGFGERDRRVIDPPPIVQLRFKEGVTKPDPEELRYPFNVVHCTLYSADSLNDETAVMTNEKRSTRRLMGTLVASPFVALDEDGVEGCFFVFPDLSCRTHGTYRLRFQLMKLIPTNLARGNVMPIIAEAMTDEFKVFTAKEFPGMRKSSPLTIALKRQGCNIPAKQGKESKLSAEKNEVSDDEGVADSPPATVSKGRKRRREDD
jgi:hypothetical protein